jgi:hypothetical protein
MKYVRISQKSYILVTSKHQLFANFVEKSKKNGKRLSQLRELI